MQHLIAFAHSAHFVRIKSTYRYLRTSKSATLLTYNLVKGTYVLNLQKISKFFKMNAGVGVSLGFIVFVISVSAEESGSLIRLKNSTPDGPIIGIASWQLKSPPTESSGIKSTGKIPAGGSATIEIPSKTGPQKITFTVNSLQMSDIIALVSKQTILLPAKKCFTVSGVRGNLTMNQETC